VAAKALLRGLKRGAEAELVRRAAVSAGKAFVRKLDQVRAEREAKRAARD